MSTLRIFLFVSLILTCGCGQKSQDHIGHDNANDAVSEDGSNEALYSQVMKIHDEAMMKMNDIYTLKQTLNSRLADSVQLDAAKKELIKNTIAKLDSANDGMMIWMRAFNPTPDSLGHEKAREYLESEMEKVKEVRDRIQEALEEGKAVQ